MGDHAVVEGVYLESMATNTPIKAHALLTVYLIISFQ